MAKTWMTKQQGCLNGGIGSGRVQKLPITFTTLQHIMNSFGHMENSSSPHSWAAWTAAAEAALTRLFCVLMKLFWSSWFCSQSCWGCCAWPASIALRKAPFSPSESQYASGSWSAMKSGRRCCEIFKNKVWGHSMSLIFCEGIDDEATTQKILKVRADKGSMSNWCSGYPKFIQ